MDVQNSVSPQCWTKLLCLAQSANDGSNAESDQLMSKQDQKFIENAMAQTVHTTDPVRHMKKHIEELKMIGKSKDEVDNLTEIVDNLEELICDIDCAADFCKLGGLVEIIRLLKSDCDSIRCEIARLIPLLAQNNPDVQNIMLETDLLPYLLAVLEEINASEGLLIKVLSSLSSLVRAHEKAFSQFCQLNGLKRIEHLFQKAVDTNYSKVADKAVLITTSIAISLGPDVVQHNILPALFRMSLQLARDSTGCSYFADYLTNIIVDKELDDSDPKNDEFKMNFVDLDNQSKENLRVFLKRQLEYEEKLHHEDCLKHLERLNAILNKEMKSS